jgi:hypothetical protein
VDRLPGASETAAVSEARALLGRSSRQARERALPTARG